ncbi:unnamed protein product [Calicophoron daubneyi]|uniref:Uncharacterized protein n=1 Tax=Calicophoron daubneyi TaxID=300641 RepID=A0AAV2U098_CALDB
MIAYIIFCRCTDENFRTLVTPYPKIHEVNTSSGFSTDDHCLPVRENQGIVRMGTDFDARSYQHISSDHIRTDNFQDATSSPGNPSSWQDGSHHVLPNPEATSDMGKSYRALPVYQFENGRIFDFHTLSTTGLAEWAKQLWETGMYIRQLVQEDWGAVAGLAALILVNYKSINCGLFKEGSLYKTVRILLHSNEKRLNSSSYSSRSPEADLRTPLSKPSEVYSLHHRFVEMLKSHCCSTVHNSQSNVQSLNVSSTPRKSFKSSIENTYSASVNRIDSTYFSKVFQQRDAIRSLTRTNLLLPLMQMLDNHQLVNPWLQEVIELMRNSE